MLTGGSSASVGGLPGALHARTIGAVDIGSALAADADVRVRGWAAAAHIAVASTSSGLAHVVGDARWRVVAEFASARVVVLSVAGMTALVAGDIGAADEAALVAQVGSLNADVLVVPHHGASQDVGFLRAVHPRLAIVSVGRGNSQHDPSPSVLKTLSDVVRPHGRVARTDEDGDVAIAGSSRGPHVVSRTS